MTFEDFIKQIDFRTKGTLGCELEMFFVKTIGGHSQFLPYAARFLKAVNDPKWTHELSACQIELRSAPQYDPCMIKSELQLSLEFGRLIALAMGVQLHFVEVAPEYIPLNVFEENPRYEDIARNMREDVLRAACRVAGLHVHYGIKNWQHGIKVHNKFAENTDYFLKLGDMSGDGRRMKLYSVVYSDWRPKLIETPEHFYHIAMEKGFADNLRNNWSGIRISQHGTVEIRLFGATANLDHIGSILYEVKRIGDSVPV